MTVVEIFDAELTGLFKEKTDVLNFLLKHERKNLVIENLDREIRIAELGTTKMNQKNRSDMIRGIAHMFANNALKNKHELILSDINRKKLIQKADHLKEAEQFIEEVSCVVQEIDKL